MTEPTVHPATEQLYDSLPEMYRLADETQDWDLERFLSLLGDQLGEVRDIADRINYVPPDEGGTPGDTSDLVDPETADASWLPWLAQLVGVHLAPGSSEASQRSQIASAASGWQAGTVSAIQVAAGTVLTGSKTVQIYPQSVTAPGDGGRWDLLLMTRPEETPDASAVIPAVVAAGAKPVGVLLHHQLILATYDAMRTDHGPTYADWSTQFPTYDDATTSSG